MTDTTDSANCYHMRTIEYEDLTDERMKDLKDTFYLFWRPHPDILRGLVEQIEKAGITERILEVGPGNIPFPKATHLMDWNTQILPNRQVFKIDLDYDLLPYETAYFRYAYCRHTLEDLQNPLHAFKEITRAASAGYIETPSPVIELLRGVDQQPYNICRGYCHHRYIVWSEKATNTLYFLPKYPVIERASIEDTIQKRMDYLATEYPVYWNNYYTWDTERPPKIVVYRNGVNMDIITDYSALIERAIISSIEYTNAFIGGLQDKIGV